ncbi:phosphoenolpyruvate synthase [Halomicroarcula sp. S1AR25-4]|uniref:phosphoenolpyruvate synthase n=1 Tax=Haloarcula sp. S1AR25-4 TaxID=2950538 RepID=UPI002875A450|nr:phosphoenolpyruvate synthase [Halomicroarcula sp. S1AR25-4]MDS0279533.1 phosphoenolpyruvate synthase [Halomicroarcula sp. S1AR25-4]
MPVAWLSAISTSDVDSAGGKGASLGELRDAGLPVPPAFVVTAETYRAFIEEAGIADDLFEAVDVDSEDSAALASAEQRARELIVDTDIPERVESSILAAYDDFEGDPFVAVRSSATAEDLPDASFAGQQETFLNVDRADLLDRIKRCWASLFTQRAIYYRDQQGFDHETVDIAVVVQRMVDAEKSGVMFTRHPSTGEPEITVEAAWGLGEAVVSGAVSPDNYSYDREAESIETVTVATKKTMHVRDDETGETVERSVPDEKQDERVLDETELAELHSLGELIEDHYDQPQDVEWATSDSSIYLLQSRPITTIEGSADESRNDHADTDGGGTSDVLVDGLGASPGTVTVTGTARVVGTLDQLDKVNQGDIIVTEMTTPDMVPAMKRAGALVTDEGGMTSHAAIVSRELGVPAVIGSENATSTLTDDQMVSVDGDRGVVADGHREPATDGEPRSASSGRPDGSAGDTKPMTATDIKVNVSIPEAAERAAATGADGVGLLRVEHMVLSTNKTPQQYVDDHGEEAFVNTLTDSMRTVAEAFYPRPVRVRTLDAPSDEFRQLEGGDDEPSEHNPMLGYRGIRRSLEEPETFKLQLRAFKKLYEMGYDSLELMLPLVTDAEDVHRATASLREVGIDPEKRDWGVMVETPASALCIEELCETGLDFVSFGTNDLTQYTLAVDRNNGTVADRYDELHPAVMGLLHDVIETCREYDVSTSICGQAASKPRMIQELVDAGITSVSVNVDAVHDAQREAKRVEQRLILESVRD